MTEDQAYERELTYFKMNLLNAEIEMNAMIAENKYLEMRDNDVPRYRHKDFMDLVEKYHIHHNAFPFG